MDPHCSLKKKKNLLALLYNKIHQLNLNSFLEFLYLEETGDIGEEGRGGELAVVE